MAEYWTYLKPDGESGICTARPFKHKHENHYCWSGCRAKPGNPGQCLIKKEYRKPKYPDRWDIENYIQGTSSALAQMMTDDDVNDDGLFQGKFAKLPPTLVIYSIRGNQKDYVARYRYRPIGYRAGFPLFFYPWIECIHDICLSAMRWNAGKKCDGKRPEDLKEVKTGIMTIREGQMKLTQARMKECTAGRNNIGKFHNIGKFSPTDSTVIMQEPPTCAAKMEIKLGFCNTCCCKNGFAGTDIQHSLIRGEISKCGAWFGMIDTGARLIISTFRSGTILDRYGMKCYKHM